MSMLRILISLVLVPELVLLHVLVWLSGSACGNSSLSRAMRDGLVPEDWIPVAWAMRCSWDALRLLSQVYELRRDDDMRIFFFPWMALLLALPERVSCCTPQTRSKVLCRASWMPAYIICTFHACYSITMDMSDDRY
jgi:hypothetical protein